MSCDEYEQACFLTPSGWVLGGLISRGCVKNPALRPKKTVLTLVKMVEQSSPFSAEIVSWRELWRSSKTPAKDIARLRKKFGNFPNHTG
jgi:hypothetical protein